MLHPLDMRRQRKQKWGRNGNDDVLSLVVGTRGKNEMNQKQYTEEVRGREKKRVCVKKRPGFSKLFNIITQMTMML